MKIECSVEEVEKILNHGMSLSERLGRAEQEVSNARDKMYEWQDKAANLQNKIDAYPQSQGSINEQEIRQLIHGVLSGNKIQAIKCVRSLLHLGLKESKDLVEECQAQGAADKVDRQNQSGFQAGGRKTLDVPLTPMRDEQGTEGLA